MKKFIIVALYTIALSSLRLADSMVTHSLLSTPEGRFTELNPFADTDRVMDVFFSPVLLVLSLLSIGAFAWMVYHPKKVLIANKAVDLSPRSSFAKELLDFPFLFLTFIAVAVINNTCMLAIGRPLLPKVFNDFLVDSPMLGLICIATVLYVLIGRVSRRTMLSILRSVSANDDAR